MGNKPETVLEEMREVFEDMCADAEAFLNKGNKSAGRRSRTNSSKLDKLTKQWRKLTLLEEKE